MSGDAKNKKPKDQLVTTVRLNILYFLPVPPQQVRDSQVVDFLQSRHE